MSSLQKDLQHLKDTKDKQIEDITKAAEEDSQMRQTEFDKKVQPYFRPLTTGSSF